MPDEGRLILCSNHRLWNDPFFIAITIKRNVCFMAKRELSAGPIMKWAMEKLGTIAVNRDGNDALSLKLSLKALKDERILAIFPEGTRNKTIRALLEFKPGAAALAIKTQTKIVPVYIDNKQKLFGTVRVIFGKAIDLSEYYNKRLSGDDMKKITNELVAPHVMELYEYGDNA